jgi:hypothetical protein
MLLLACCRGGKEAERGGEQEVHGAGRTGRICHQNKADYKCRLWIAKEIFKTFRQTYRGEF